MSLQAAQQTAWSRNETHKLGYYERWIVAFANILLRKELITPTEIALKLKEVQARLQLPSGGTAP